MAAATSAPITLHSTVTVVRDQIFSNLSGESVILHLGSGTYYGLDAVGTWVWEQIQQPRTVGDLCAAMLAEYEVERERCEHDVIVLLQQLAAAGLIEVTDAPAA